MFLALACLAVVAAVAGVYHANRDALHDTVSHLTTGGRLLIRIDPGPVPLPLRVAAIVAAGLGALGVASPLLWTRDTITPAAGVALLAAIGALALAVFAFDAGWIRPRRSHRLSVGADEVWWDALAPADEPGPEATSAATRAPRADCALVIEGDDAVVTAPGSGVVFGPLPPEVLEILQARWA